MTGISKRFGNVQSLRDVDFQVARQEVHALLGQNGAGKTTLMNILCGSYRRDAGQIFLHGREVDIRTPGDAIAHGVGMVHQHPELVQAFTGFENVMLGAEHRAWSANVPLHQQRIRELARRYGFDLDLNQTVRDLPLGHQQKIEILRTLYLGAKVLVLDEPTTHLTPNEIDGLFEAIRQLVASGLTVILVAHKLREVLAISDRITVLNQGRHVGSVRTTEANEELLIGMVMGAARPDASGTKGSGREAAGESRGRPPSIRLISVCTGGHSPIDVSLEVHPGEVVGIAGIAGNGQEELVDVVAGIRPVDRGSILLGGRDITSLPAWERIALGLGVVPADRLRDGILPAAPVYESFALGLHNVMDGWVWRPRTLRRWARRQILDYGIVTADERAPTALMSGGNIQKLLVARAIAVASRSASGVLVAANPTHGLDVGATSFVHSRLVNMRDQHRGLLILSEDLDELMKLSDRILVLRGGRIVSEHGRSAFNHAAIGLHMLGHEDG